MKTVGSELDHPVSLENTELKTFPGSSKNGEILQDLQTPYSSSSILIEERSVSYNMSEKSCSSDEMVPRHRSTRFETLNNRSRVNSTRLRAMGTPVLPPRLQCESREFKGRPITSCGTLERTDRHVSQIISHMDDTSLPKQIDTLRDLSESLTVKRQVKANLQRTETERSNAKPISCCKRVKYSISMSFQKSKEALRGVLYSLELWYSSLKTIEGHFGSGVATYFKFLRWLFLLNSVVLIISLGCLIVPQIFMRFFKNWDEKAENLDVVGIYLQENLLEISDDNRTTPPPPVTQYLVYKSNPYSQNDVFHVGDLFTGEGFFTFTALYYGYYSNKSLELVSGYKYNIPNAYFFSMFFCYLFIFLAVSVSMAWSYRTNFIETRGGQNNIYALKLFCGWDFSIATPEAASLNKKRIFNEIKEVLDERKYQRDDSDFLSYFTTVVVQLCLNMMFVLLMAGTALLMWDLLGRHSTYVSANHTSTSSTMLMSLFISIIMNVFPMGFSWIVRYEDYRSPRTALYVTLLRTFVLNMVVIGVLLFFRLKNSQECWETSLGQEVYRLIVIDFLISTIATGLAESARFCIFKWYWKGMGQPEFDIARNTLNLIYNQTLFWVGFYFSPLLAAVIVLKLFITFYLKKAGALHNCQAPSRSWRAAQTQTVFLILTFITLLGVLLVYGYILVMVPASECGPFQEYRFMYEMILEGILQLEKNHIFWKLIMFMVKPGVVGGLLVAMSVAVYILRSKSQAHSVMVEILRHMLILEARDKEFLFKTIDRLEKIYQKKGSPAVSSSSSLRTPLSERKITKKRLEGNSVLLAPLSSRKTSLHHWSSEDRLHSQWQNGYGWSTTNLKVNDNGTDDTGFQDRPSGSSSSSGTSQVERESYLMGKGRGSNQVLPHCDED